MRIQLHSSIPIGCGMGSSAATIVSFVKAILHFFRINKGIEWVEKLILDVERFQHGHPSGVDSFVSLHGGCFRFQKGKAPQHLDMPLHSMWIILTGHPESSTGECVTAVAEKWEKSTIWNEFEQVSVQFEKGLHEKGTDTLARAIKENHRLLSRIGVVPEKVQAFIAAIEKIGGAAKISGAGSVRGASGGVVIALSDPRIEALCKEFDYHIFPLEGEILGATVHRC